jgi:PAS domain S-box-containing protein
MERIRCGERVEHYETWRVRRDGSQVPVSVTVSPVRDHTGAIIGASDITRDISSRKAAEAIRQLLAAIVSSSEDAILSKDLEGNITSWNAAAERLFGYPAHEIIGQSVSRLFPPDQQDEFAQIMDGIRRGERVEHHETMRVRRDGRLVPVSVTISPVKDDQGVIVGASDITRDISTRVALERQREAFLSLVTHELKTPITSLQANLQLAQRRLARLASLEEPSREEQHHIVEQVQTILVRSQQPVRVQQRLINDLLDLAHLQEGKIEVHLEPCDLVGLVAETVQDQQAAHPSRLITLDLPDQDPILVYADQDRLQQVLNNYLTNALKFSPETEPVRVGIALEAGTARVWVHDQGPGLTAEQQRQIWQQFYQAPTTPVQSGWKPGLGLGLYISQQLILRQHGEVGVESRPGQGATFWFALPMHASMHEVGSPLGS